MTPTQQMFAIAFGTYGVCKATTWTLAARQMEHVPAARSVGYLLAWPGMDATAFLKGERTIPAHASRRALLAHALLGILFLAAGIRLSRGADTFVAGWLGLIGLVLLFHFTAFQLLADFWGAMGVPVTPVMRNPLAATTLGDFWGRRWNTAFHQLAQNLIFRPLHRRVGVVMASLLTFIVSGLVHDLVISVPAHGGYGLPTAYFTIQGLALLVERRWRIHRGPLARLFTIAVVAGPAFWLFHPPFILRVVVPLLLGIDRLFADLRGVPMNHLALLLWIGGVLQFGILIGSALVPGVLKWKTELRQLSPINRHLIWTHGAFIVLTIIGLGTIAVTNADALANGTHLARTICTFIAVFWGVRLSLQFALFDPGPLLRTRLLAVGYHGLTVVFAYLTAVFGYAAILSG